MGVKIYTIASACRGMAPIPVRDNQSRKHRMGHGQGQNVDERTLQTVAEDTKRGTFHRAIRHAFSRNLRNRSNRWKKKAQTVAVSSSTT